MGPVTKIVLHTAAVFLLVISAYAQEKKENYAVMNLKNGEGITEGEASIITDRLRSELFSTGRVNMMERDQMQNILKEQGFQQSGACTDQACMVEMGQLLGVSKLISGSIGKLGSMFLLNFRTIDVQTAQITKAVKSDITGGIEDVVKELPKIASQLTGIKKEPVTAQTLKTKTAEPTEQYLEGKEEKKINPSENEKTPTGTDKKYDNAENRNRNRAGLRLSISFFPGEAGFKVDFAGLEEGFTDHNEIFPIQDSALAELYPLEYEDVMFFTFGIGSEFMIKAGRIFNINLGPVFSLYHRYSKTDREELDQFNNVINVSYEENLWLFAPSVRASLVMVKRAYPFKFNFGLVSEFIVYILNLDYSDDSENSDHLDDYYITSVSPSGAIGCRGGIEFLAGDNFSLGLDLNVMFKRVTFYDLENDGPGITPYAFTWDDLAFRFTLPPFGIKASTNFYF